MKGFAELFPDEAACDAYLIQIRWPDGIRCPRCGSVRVYPLRGFKHKWECPDCRVGGAYRFSHLVGTIFANTKVDLRDWFEVVRILKISENKLGAREIQKIMGFGSYGTAWHICHRIRAAMQKPSWLQKLFDRLDSITPAEAGAVIFYARPSKSEKATYGTDHRVMCLGEMPNSPATFDELLINARLSAQKIPYFGPSIRLISYMAWPNDSDARVGFYGAHGVEVLENSDQLSEVHWAHDSKARVFRKRLGAIQRKWLAVAKVVRHVQTLHQGGHQKRRGGASLGKAIEIVDQQTVAFGSGTRTVQKTWHEYKDVAHLATATMLLFVHVRNLVRKEGWRFSDDLVSPIPLILLFPDVILAGAKGFEKFGLKQALPWRQRPLLDPVTTWRIPKLKLASLTFLQRPITKDELGILRNRIARPRRGQKKRDSCKPEESPSTDT